MKPIHYSSSWQDPSCYLEGIFLEQSCRDNSLAEDIISRAGLPVTIISEHDFPEIVGGLYPENLSEGKKHLLLCKNRGEFLKSCPATREYRCCDYQVINMGMGCPMDCVYCILQAYLNNPYLSFFVNTDDLFEELSAKLDSAESSFMRIGTGEFTDSMALDRFTGLSGQLVTFFASRSNAVLELKTKSCVIDNLKNLDHNGRTIISWSLNTSEIIAKEEFRASTLEERLEAAAICVSWGYRLAFHFDPVLVYPGWREGYTQTIQKLFEAVPAAAIAWISIGAFRYLPKLKQIGTSRFPESKIFYHEFIEGLDNKQRYFRPLRIQLYQHIYEELRKWAAPETCIYFCMESDEIWNEVMGFLPADRGGLPAMLDRSVRTV